MGTRLNLICLCLLVSLLLQSCDHDAAPPEQTPSKTEVLAVETSTVIGPPFDADSAYAYIAQQVAFGPRVPNTPQHVACGDWLSSELTRHGAKVIEQPGLVRAYDGTILRIRNFIGQFRPNNRERILLFAHWDTRPFADKDTLRIREPIEGANDGGSGIGVLLEIARLLGSDSTLELGVDIVFFDAEDYGIPEWGEKNQNSALTWCLGSQYWANQPHRIGYNAKYGILLDMVGAKGAVFNKEGTSMAYAPYVVERLWSSAERLGYGNYFKQDVTPETIDDNLFVSEFAGIPSANIVHYQVQVLPMGYGPFHHTHADNLSIISTATLEAVGNTVIDVIWND
ncbi:MAG TPA: glutamine cyclotransferase [Flavobacteriales bacterium]|nr:glutamine cyclotransferase [Flavobacteriales bacterium]